MSPVERTDGAVIAGWRRPDIFLILLAIAMPLAFSTWQALLNNFAIEEAGVDGIRIGILQSLREIPGFLSFAVVFMLILIREQPLALLSLLLLGIGTAITGLFPSVIGLYLTILVSKLESDACFLNGIVNLDRLIKCTGETFFAVNVFSSPGSGHGDPGVPVIWCSNNHGINIFTGQ